MKATVINLFAGPGAGKSTTAAGVFYKLKSAGVDCEYIQEFAKDMTWEERHLALNNQPYIFGKQYHRMCRVGDKVDVIVTDSPLLLSLYYNRGALKSLDALVRECSHRFFSLDFFIERMKKYNPNGRNQTEEQAKAIDADLKHMLLREGRHVTTVPGNDSGVERIANVVLHTSLGSNNKCHIRNQKTESD